MLQAIVGIMNGIMHHIQHVFVVLILQVALYGHYDAFNLLDVPESRIAAIMSRCDVVPQILVASVHQHAY